MFSLLTHSQAFCPPHNVIIPDRLHTTTISQHSNLKSHCPCDSLWHVTDQLLGSLLSWPTPPWVTVVKSKVSIPKHHGVCCQSTRPVPSPTCALPLHIQLGDNKTRRHVESVRTYEYMVMVDFSERILIQRGTRGVSQTLNARSHTQAQTTWLR